MQYQVQNQSQKPKRLVMLTTPGISKIAPCVLAPRDKAGSSCILNLSITGSALPREGIHHGPIYVYGLKSSYSSKLNVKSTSLSESLF
ncbi:MAG: hypothetical protein P4L79_11735 [Legionella sp.]|uniref:hypothetical protein n=1 Tax=Legionella sp. TaxID=459 RepID=UPI002842482B|nr:hypothetical protein [Legionella sp.]